VRHLGYVGMLAFCLLGTLPLEVLLGVRVYRQWRRLALTLLCVAPVFVVWDLYAVASGHWRFDPDQTIGVTVPGDLPLEELLFFLVVPVCSVLALEAVRKVTGWDAGYPAQEAE
jgi:lycopene cyclase domain-containing protein